MKKKGFTLLELLAVIVVLAIIALIAIPIVADVIEKARKSAFKSSVYGIIKATEYLPTMEMLRDSKEVIVSYEDGNEITSVPGVQLEYTGQKPKSGTILIDGDGKTSLALFNGTYCVQKQKEQEDVSVFHDKTEEECLLESPIPQNKYADGTKASIPEVSSGMIPIRWDGSKWIKANVYLNWYHYGNKEWANAVLVTEGKRTEYQNAPAGKEMLEDDILAYFVWIPRYQYKLFNTDGELLSEPYPTIEIEFEQKESKSSENVDGQWLTHPAFTFGTGNEQNGIWVGKFETSTSPELLCYTSSSSTNCGNENQQPRIKPNVTALRSQRPYHQFVTAQNFNQEQMYGLTAFEDAHMMKNTEWGAVVYLTASTYGKNTEVWNNPNSNYTTGCAGTSASVSSTTTCENYHSQLGVQASTTGNVYGVYDMAGGTWERVMGNNAGIIEFSYFPELPAEKYYDLYQSDTSSSTVSRRILGDATAEVRRWMGDYGYFVVDEYPWFNRGGMHSNGSNAGIFAFHNSNGYSDSSYGFRVTITSSE